MTRMTALFACLVFLGSLSLAQNPSEQPGMDSHMGRGMGMMGVPGMHEQMMKDMQTDLDSMRSNLQKMKDQLGKVSDRGAKDQLQLNIDMWQSFIDHMDKHMATMRKMMDSRKGASTDETKHEHEHVPATPAQ